jgi:copper chaperone
MGQIVTVQVAGMDCTACERRLQAVLGRLDGVGDVDADHVTGVVRVRFDAACTTADVVAARAAERITQAGFAVTGRRQEEDEQGARS